MFQNYTKHISATEERRQGVNEIFIWQNRSSILGKNCFISPFICKLKNLKQVRLESGHSKHRTLKSAHFLYNMYLPYNKWIAVWGHTGCLFYSGGRDSESYKRTSQRKNSWAKTWNILAQSWMDPKSRVFYRSPKWLQESNNMNHPLMLSQVIKEGSSIGTGVAETWTCTHIKCHHSRYSFPAMLGPDTGWILKASMKTKSSPPPLPDKHGWQFLNRFPEK